MSETPNLGLVYLEAAQAQKHVTHNEALRRLDALVQIAVLDRDLAAPPTSPANGARYIIGAAPTGEWAGRAGQLTAFQDGAWTFLPPKDGWLTYVVDEAKLVVRAGASWVEVSAGGGGGSLTGPQSFSQLGIGTAADAANPLAARLNNALLVGRPLAEGGSGDLRLKLSKEAAVNTASLLLQDGFSGRAEFGLLGDDDLRLKVSADGTTWNDAFAVARATGAIAFPKGAMQVETVVFTTSGTWTKPDWARSVRVVMIGAGGGGGAGALRGPGIANGGGAGGAGGLYITEDYLASELPASVAVTIGAGGTGAAAVTAADGNGASGVYGGWTTFGPYLGAPPAPPGTGGSTSGGTGSSNTAATTYNANSAGGAGGTGAAGSTGSASAIGVGPSGAGGGGGVSAANAAANGGGSGTAYGQAGASFQAPGATGGTGAGANGSARPGLRGAGSGAAGGASSATGNGFAGGNGGNPGGGGGGGGAARNGFASGAGGKGGNGEVRITSYG